MELLLRLFRSRGAKEVEILIVRRELEWENQYRQPQADQAA